jgi:hypothetical protein
MPKHRVPSFYSRHPVKIKTVLLLLPAAAIATVLAQGPLTPPPGAPAPVMKTLDQIEPRTPVSSLPFTIGQPGSYYLTDNFQFTAATGHAISINASDVTLDLMGFRLSSSSGVTGDAIHLVTGLRNVEVRNGTITGNTAVLVSGTAPNQSWTVSPAGFNGGIIAPPSPAVTGCHYSHLRISRCRTAGLNGGEQALLEDVSATQNGDSGIDVSNESTVTHCTATQNGNHGISSIGGSVSNCLAISNKATGIFGESVANSRASANGGTGINSSCVNNCVAASNGSDGISGASATISNSKAVNNHGTGIGSFAGSITNCTAIGNDNNGIAGTSASIANCVASTNTGDGILTTSGSVTNCTSNSNGDNGINADSSVIAFCKASSNNVNNNGSTNIVGTLVVRTGNNPAP